MAPFFSGETINLHNYTDSTPETPHNYEGSSAIIIGIKNFLRLAAFYAFHAYIG